MGETFMKQTMLSLLNNNQLGTDESSISSGKKVCGFLKTSFSMETFTELDIYFGPIICKVSEFPSNGLILVLDVK